jgi:hypothetical protein
VCHNKGAVRLEVNQMLEFPKVISKKLWFLLFNVGTIVYLLSTGTLRWEFVSVLACFLALTMMNGIAWISARKYKQWK